GGDSENSTNGLNRDPMVNMCFNFIHGSDNEAAFPTRDVRYGEAFHAFTRLDARQDRENIVKASAMPYEASPRVTSLGGDEGIEDTGKDSDKSADKGSDSTDEMANVSGTLGAANILASGGLRSFFTTASLLVATASTVVSPAIATAYGSFPTAAIFTTASVATPTTRVTRSSRGFVFESSSLIFLARDLEAKFAQEDQIIREQAERDSVISRIHAERELEMIIAELDRSNEMVAKYLSEYEQAKAGLSYDEKSEEPKELSDGDLKKIIELVPLEELYIEALQVKYPIIDWEIYFEGQRKEDLDKLWSLVKETCSTTEVIDEKEKELWVELKSLYEPNSRDPLWALQRYMHDPLEIWLGLILYRTLWTIKGVLRAIHMTGNKSYLTDYEEIDGGFVTIGGSGPNWLFDIDVLTKSMSYKPVVAGIESNGSAGTKACDNIGKTRVETVPDKDYILLPLWTKDPPFSSSTKDSPGAGYKPSKEEEKRTLKI
nr:hypothetical protein [Tanacetum cinerariifolium]